MFNTISALEKFGKNHDISDLTFNADGYLNIVLQDEFTIHLQLNSNKDMLSIFSEVADLSKTNNTILFSNLLKANYFGQHTNQYNFGINPDDNTLILFKSIDDSIINTSSIENLICDLLEAVIYWKSHITSQLQEKQNKQVKKQIPNNQFSFIHV
ncbi:type III secretion system chaperone [uncultured Shewanella sp.]|uniref:type III secretion system chaperone n=1 Tax=uncultured Shewanella sp. TaxID=173975 RepID=UPI00260E94D1|nr:type III secretion system chaperone [uncultured Shewanella sp.]